MKKIYYKVYVISIMVRRKEIWIRTGCKRLGFKAIFAKSDYVMIYSNGEPIAKMGEK